mmetsp:Transcript_8784/g.13109  ORF Transcript_8784/g.13109 Transcript_8784/m.13109 type:complete len:196 (-) Transcript_8784:560-1147(-)|eukprot:CAMPEP_0203694990 /NCGR_PEP_ID=MMETSP0091-20130426/6566_1 /ASSEMBLY_ACC=CAM_ASM_001089 /TAXON_ID=426623 /ORGANISM="Chaetoceros affinis, Strain CCMP159" /LENGTH=195 /DNA_ID=CAMNT_0050566447 /DNA_START=109 /DNA_END=696 /DNA_ORIENTATION=+
MSSSSHNFEEDEGAKRPIPSFDTSSIKLSTLGIGDTEDSMPDYLEYDTSGRGLMQTMFANAGLSYLLGTLGGGIYGFNEGLKHTPSHRFRVKLNSVLNHCSRHGSRFGNMLGVWSVMYSFYENFADQLDIDQYTGPVQPVGPALAAFATGATYKSQAGPRVAGLAGVIGLGAVGITYTAYSILGVPYGKNSYLFF